MKKILKDLFYGNIRPIDEQKFKKGLMEKISKAEKELNELLNGKEKELLNSYMYSQMGLNAATALENFEKGFKLAFKLFFVGLK